jgi:predicted dehydrogenase
MSIRFAAIGLNHSHIDGQVKCLLDAGAEFVAFHAIEDELALPFAERFPHAKRIGDKRAILEDSSIQMVVTAAILNERAGVALEAMRHGKDVMSDKPGMTSLDQLAELRQVQAETGRIFSVCYSEHFQTPSTVRAGELVTAGAIGEVVNTVGLGPHALNNNKRPSWFFDRKRYGGILCDIGSHQVEQFLFFTGSADAEVATSQVANFDHPEHPEFEDFGQMVLVSGQAAGFIRVDWFTQDAFPVWGDGRLFLMGSDGTIELRKYADMAGRPGGDHLFIANRTGVRHIDCSDTPITYGEQLRDDVLNRTETAMSQAHCFKATELALVAQAKAQRIGGDRP